MSKRKILGKALAGSENDRFEKMVTLVQAYGSRLSRVQPNWRAIINYNFCVDPVFGDFVFVLGFELDYASPYTSAHSQAARPRHDTRMFGPRRHRAPSPGRHLRTDLAGPIFYRPAMRRSS